ncbi:hypothetical protein AMK06_CH01964 [Rhizobium sp. N541]|nr:hypothetical protein AMK05_CH01995 [Rhizobium sp. N324]ANM16866.1 hypothetical protein AMK06_CH01964 [Rhizobium sp. N541]ANM23251.1 hypothetical protein AMK07_CH01961 [Rhizobium sp. N941]
MIQSNAEIAESAYLRPFFRKAKSMELQAFPVFDARPPLAYIESWRRHIADTGSPETFDNVSSTKPPKNASVILLSEVVSVPMSLRLGGDRVPCPLCSPTSPKFGKGRMAWFPDECVVRFIGHSCAKRYLGENYSAAERLFKIEAACADFIERWPRVQDALPQIGPVVRNLYGVGQRLSQLRAYIDRQAPGFARSFHGDLVTIGGRVFTSREAGVKSSAVLGLKFLSEDFNPGSVAEKLMSICRDIKNPLPNWQVSDGEGAASREIIRRGRSASRYLKEMSALRDQIEDAAEFLTVTNLRILEQWCKSGNSPFTVIMFARDGERIDGVVESYAGRYGWSVVYPGDLLMGLPTKDEISNLGISEIFG